MNRPIAWGHICSQETGRRIFVVQKCPPLYNQVWGQLGQHEPLSIRKTNETKEVEVNCVKALSRFSRFSCMCISLFSRVLRLGSLAGAFCSGFPSVGCVCGAREGAAPRLEVPHLESCAVLSAVVPSISGSRLALIARILHPQQLTHSFIHAAMGMAVAWCAAIMTKGQYSSLVVPCTGTERYGQVFFFSF